MAVVNLKHEPPKQAPGHKVADALRRGTYMRQKAEQLVGPDVGTIEIFTVPAYTWIEEINMYVSGAVSGAITATVGDADDVDRFMDNTATGLGSTGWKSSRADAQPGSNGYLYTAADTIDMVLAGTPAAGTVDIWLKYQLDWDELDLAP